MNSGTLHLVASMVIAMSLLTTACLSAPVPSASIGVSGGPFAVDLVIDASGRVTVVTSVARKFPIVSLGGISLNVGIAETLELTKQKRFTLFILYRDSSNNLLREEYEIGKEFVVRFNSQDHVRQISGSNDSVIIAVERPESTVQGEPKAPNDAPSTEVILDDSDIHVIFEGSPEGWRFAPYGYKGSTH